MPRVAFLVLSLLLVAACKKPASGPAAPDGAVFDPCPKGATYLACGCGCCGGGSEGARRKCIETDEGESLASVEAKDRAAKADPNCRVMGCSLGVLYECCD